MASVQLALTVAWIPAYGFPWSAPPLEALQATLVFGGLLLLAIAARAGLARLGLHRPFDQARAAVDAGLIGLLMGVVSIDYSWLKLLVPGLNHRTWDTALGAIDRALIGGLDPNRFLLAIFQGNPRWVGFAFDGAYALWMYLALAGCIVLLSSADRALRWRAAGSLAFLWLAGAWLYVAFPALGPALVDFDLWTQVRVSLPNSAGAERELLRNYAAVKSILAGTSVPVHVSFGVGAMPSLHVGVDVLLALWARHQARAWAWTWWILSGITAIGAVATGWHYLTDVLAGVALALLAHAATR